MPRFDGTGPMGMGPGTGRGWGFCYNGMKRGFGLGRYFGFGNAKKTKQDLEEYKKALSEELEAVEEEIKNQ